MFSSILYHKFDSILLLAHGRALYSGPGGFAPVEHFARSAPGIVAPYQQGYNIAEYLLEVASDPPVNLFTLAADKLNSSVSRTTANEEIVTSEKPNTQLSPLASSSTQRLAIGRPQTGIVYNTTFLTQLQYLSGREWKVLKRDKSLFLMHLGVSALLGVFCGTSHDIFCKTMY